MVLPEAHGLSLFRVVREGLGSSGRLVPEARCTRLISGDSLSKANHSKPTTTEGLEAQLLILSREVGRGVYFPLDPFRIPLVPKPALEPKLDILQDAGDTHVIL
jgi:hypothetical protein